MTCRPITEDDKCQHGIPIESTLMHDCPHDGLTCSPCSHPDCHTVRPRKVPGPLAKLLPVCVLCGPVGVSTDSEGVKEARAGHLQEVAR